MSDVQTLNGLEDLRLLRILDDEFLTDGIVDDHFNILLNFQQAIVLRHQMSDLVHERLCS